MLGAYSAVFNIAGFEEFLCERRCLNGGVIIVSIDEQLGRPPDIDLVDHSAYWVNKLSRREP